MDKKCTIQEVVHIPSDTGFGIDEVADLIDSEIALERRGKDGEIVKVDSVSIVCGNDGDIRFPFPFVHSGAEFRDYVKCLERFCHIK